MAAGPDIQRPGIQNLRTAQIQGPLFTFVKICSSDLKINVKIFSFNLYKKRLGTLFNRFFDSLEKRGLSDHHRATNSRR